MRSVILTDIIQMVLETSECFISKYTNNMHILATGTEEQEVYSGHLWAPYSSKLLNTAPSHKKLNSHHQPATTQLLNPDAQRLLPYRHGITGHFNNGTLVSLIMFTYCFTHLILYVYTVFYQTTPLLVLIFIYLYILYLFMYILILIYIILIYLYT